MDETGAQAPRRVFGFHVPGRSILLAMALFAVVCVALTAMAPQKRTGDSGEYMAMTWNLTHLRPPALSLEDIARLDQHLASLEPGMTGFAGSVPTHSGLESGGRYDMLHFWTYSLVASPFVAVANVLDVPDTYGFAACNIAMFTFAFGVLLRRRGALAAVLLCCSPFLWFIDKPHTEVMIGSAVLLALLWRHDRPLWGAAAAALAMSQNISLAPMFAVSAAAVVVEHRGSLVATARRRWAVVGVAALVVVHPLYYLVRFGDIDPVPVMTGKQAELPSVRGMLTPVVDPYVGLVTWWPGLLAVPAVAGFVAAWRRRPQHRTWQEWVMVWLPAAVAVMILAGQAQSPEPGSGGTFAMTRYALWLAPCLVCWMDRSLFTGRVVRGTVVGLVAASVVLSFHVARPSRQDIWFSVGPTWVSDAVNEHAPWLWDPPPQVFLTREWRQFTLVEPVANDACTKLLAIQGRWPATCEAPHNPPAWCTAATFCYANRVGDEWWYREAAYHG